MHRVLQNITVYCNNLAVLNGIPSHGTEIELDDRQPPFPPLQNLTFFQQSYTCTTYLDKVHVTSSTQSPHGEKKGVKTYLPSSFFH